MKLHVYLRFSLAAFLFVMVLLWSSCRKDFEFQASTGSLEFSRDTVFLDTVFSNIGSSTYTLKVYNRSNTDIEIPSVRLASGENSTYRLNVDGAPGKNFVNVPLLAKDSMFIFIETTVDIGTNGNSFLATDALQFDTGDKLQEVQLVTLVKDAVFIFPPTDANGNKATLSLGLDAEGNEIRVEGISLADNQLNFTNEKPYVIYGYAAVPENRSLEIDAGARVHFHENSGIWVQPNATIQINGALSTDSLLLENEVIFEGDRLEPEFDAVPGQWGTIWLSQGSTGNNINYLTLKNATIGILAEGDSAQTIGSLNITNSQIYNSASVNLWGSTATINAENLVLGGAGAISLYCSLGGSYSFTHCTIANYWSDGFRRGPALRIDNEITLLNEEITQGDLVSASFINSIIDGNSLKEFELFDNGSNAFNFSFENCMLQYDGTTENPLLDFTNTNFYTTVFLNERAEFKASLQNNYQLELSSFAIDKGQQEAANQVPLDILGEGRTTSPDLGAYEFIPQN